MRRGTALASCLASWTLCACAAPQASLDHAPAAALPPDHGAFIRDGQSLLWAVGDIAGEPDPASGRAQAIARAYANLGDVLWLAVGRGDLPEETDCHEPICTATRLSTVVGGQVAFARYTAEGHRHQALVLLSLQDAASSLATWEQLGQRTRQAAAARLPDLHRRLLREFGPPRSGSIWDGGDPRSLPALASGRPGWSDLSSGRFRRFGRRTIFGVSLALATGAPDTAALAPGDTACQMAASVLGYTARIDLRLSDAGDILSRRVTGTVTSGQVPRCPDPVEIYTDPGGSRPLRFFYVELDEQTLEERLSSTPPPAQVSPVEPTPPQHKQPKPQRTKRRKRHRKRRR